MTGTNKKRKRWPWVVGVVAVLVIALGVAPLALGAPSRNGASDYTTYTVANGDVASTVSASGSIVDSYTYSVSPGASATLTERDGIAVSTTAAGATSASGASYRTTDLKVAVGDAVKRGQVLATAVDTSTTVAALNRAVNDAQQSVTSAYAALAADLSTLASERDSKTKTTQSVNSAKKQVSSDYVSIDSAESALASAQKDLADHTVTVTSPATGHVRSIATATNAAATTVATIGAGAKIVSVMVSEYDVARVAVGQNVRLTLGATGATFAGSIARIAQLSDDSSGVEKYQVVVSSKELPTVARVGMTVTASVAIASRDEVLNVPATAVSTSGGKSIVEVLVKGTISRKTVTVGLVGDTSVEIASGLTKGDVVVIGKNGTVPAVSTVPGPGSAG